MWSIVRGDTHMTPTLKGGVCVCVCVCVWEKGVAGVQDENEMLSDVGGAGLASLPDAQSLLFIKENWICAMTRHHVNNILLARNLSFDSDFRQWRHPLTSSMVFWKMYLQKKWRNLEFLQLLILSDYIMSHILLAPKNPALLGLRYNCIVCGLYRTVERMVNLNVT